MSALIRKAAVLGAGTMGSRIAAVLANAGLPVVLLDMAQEGAQRSALAAQALEAVKKTEPASFFEPSLAAHVTVGNFDDDLALLKDCDWVIEAVTENLKIKQALLAKVTPHLKSDAIFSTNTSGLPVASIARELPAGVRHRWLGTHFFTPPRYMRLIEIIATPETDPAVVEAMAQFADVRLGKDVIFARDTPNFIANRIGVFMVLETVRLMQAEDMTIEEIDALTSTASGWSQAGMFRLTDLIGIDIVGHVAQNFPRTHPQAGKMAVPEFITAMLERGWLGDKTAQGFYMNAGGGQNGRLVLNWKTLEYGPMLHPAFPSIEMARAERMSERLAQLVSGDASKDKAVRFHWRLVTALWNYAADCVTEIADSAALVDRAMRSGYLWEMGLFQLWDALGVRQTVERMQAAGEPVSPVVERMLATGAESWYRDGGAACYDPVTESYRPVPREPSGRIAEYRAAKGVVRQNPGASLIDLGDGVACVELHSLKTTIGADVVKLMTETLRPESDAVRNFSAFVVSADTANFSVGANLMQLLMALQDEEWDEVERMVRAFQRMTSMIKYCPRPVVVAPFGYCFGGGAEIAMHAARRQAHGELYMGLVETSVGLVPSGGGCKEMTLRAIDSGVPDAVRENFRAIAMVKISTSAAEARNLGYLTAADRITMNRTRLLGEARELARELANSGYAPPLPRTDIPAPGEAALATILAGIQARREGGFISEHDAKVVGRVAHVMCGGKITAGTPISEQYLLDLEREAFLSLCGEKKTQERMAYTLKTRKPLRN